MKSKLSNSIKKEMPNTGNVTLYILRYTFSVKMLQLLKGISTYIVQYVISKFS